ncbi:MAG: FkbM family methyltransferase [Crocinitomicaceae bacterium]
MRSIHSFIQYLLGLPKFPGRDFLIEKLPKWFLKKPKGKTIIQTRFGFKIKIDPLFDKNIENVIYERGVYELGTVSTIQQYLKPGDSFVDAGANIGFLSLLASSIVGPKGKVYAFEPVVDTFQILQENKSMNGFEQLIIHPFGLGEIEESVTIYPEKENRGGASISHKHGTEGEQIKIKTLDGLELSAVKMIKIDVEGYEMNVLTGARNTILKDQPILIVEFSSNRNNTHDPLELYQWLQELNVYGFYKLKWGKERRSSLIPIYKTEDLPEHDNLICLPINR